MTLDEAIEYEESIAEMMFNKAVFLTDKAKGEIALDNAEKYKRCAEKHRQLAEWLKELKQLRESSKWISVNEKLPNLDDYTGSRMWQKKVLIMGYLSFDDTKDLFVSEAFAKDVVHNSILNTVVVAWKPLPKPYKGKK